jgi:uncharacterized protein DUF6782
MLRILAAFLALLLGCRGTPPGAQGDEIARVVDSLRPSVERATGLRFRGPTRSALKSREEVREYLVSKLKEDFPAQREEGIRSVYRLLGLIPDSLDLKALLIDLYTEQVAGFYDPTTSTLYGVRGADPAQLRLVLAHELVHALQHQYLPLDSIMKSKGDADRQAAAQAVFEGQATLASIKVLVPGQDIVARPEFWSALREQIKAQQSTMQVFARAPLALREELIFPYLNGAEFMRWWDSAHAGRPLPTLATLPLSTEQILHPARYAAGDAPVPVRFADSSDDVLYEDTLGELEIQVLATVLRGGGEVLTDAPAGWGGDRFRIYRSSAGPALVWYTEWDDAESASRFRGGIGTRLLARERAGYRTSVDAVSGSAHPTLRVVIAPTEWSRWSALPQSR